MANLFFIFYNCKTFTVVKKLFNCSSDDLNDVSRRRVTHTFIHLVREWTEIGSEERTQSFGILMAELEKRFPDKSQRKNVRIFVPGAKLARLPFMIAKVIFNLILFWQIILLWLFNWGKDKETMCKFCISG